MVLWNVLVSLFFPFINRLLDIHANSNKNRRLLKLLELKWRLSVPVIIISGKLVFQVNSYQFLRSGKIVSSDRLFKMFRDSASNCWDLCFQSFTTVEFWSRGITHDVTWDSWVLPICWSRHVELDSRGLENNPTVPIQLSSWTGWLIRDHYYCFIATTTAFAWQRQRRLQGVSRE